MRTNLSTLMAGAFLVGFFSFTPMRAQPAAVETNPAMTNPDKFAWDLFMEVNKPALAGKRGVPDPNKKIGEPGLRVWETWKTTTRNGNEVFLDKGQTPPPWDAPMMMSAGKPKKFLSPPKIETIKEFDRSGTIGVAAAPKLTDGQESKINRIGFEFIVNEGLYSLDGQERYRATGREVSFPLGSINVKATWHQFTTDEIKEGKPSRYYTAEENGKIWGLTGFHMTTKDLPKWFWATFEHVENPVPEIGDRDRYTRFLNPRNPDASYVHQRLREVPDPLKNTVFQYYVLRGTQVDFIDSIGNPTILGNTQLEGSMQTSSSCMGCHARSTIGDRQDHITADGRSLYPRGTYFYPEGKIGGVGDTRLANRLTVNPAQVFWLQDPQKPTEDRGTSVYIMGAVGAPDPRSFMDSAGRSRYTQLDFIWAFISAHRE